MSQLRGSSLRVVAWGKDNAQLISFTGVTVVTVFLAGGSFFGLRRDLVTERELRHIELQKEKELRQNELQKERELRHKDMELRQSELQKERELRQLDVEKALAQGRADVIHSMLVYGKSVLELQHSEEYKDALWRKSASSNAE